MGLPRDEHIPDELSCVSSASFQAPAFPQRATMAKSARGLPLYLDHLRSPRHVCCFDFRPPALGIDGDDRRLGRCGPDHDLSQRFRVRSRCGPGRCRTTQDGIPTGSAPRPKHRPLRRPPNPNPRRRRARTGDTTRSGPPEKPPVPAPAPAAPAAPAATAKPPAAPAAAEPAQPVERKLRFSFRYQKWTDVLDWFAEQSELSLVIDNPPPGTFNYTDSREFTVSEAMDVLNSVLMTKGYTLVRRNRMLLVLNTADGIPPDLVPRVTKEELDKRGNFELVSMLLDLGRRDPEAVRTEVTPLLTPLGSIVVLAQTKQALITESVWKMRIIAGLVESIPERPIPPPTPKPEPPEKPELTVYPLQNSDPAKVQEVLKQLFATTTTVADSQAKQISVYGTPSQHASIKKMIDQMEANQPPDLKPRLEVYRLSPRLLTAATGSRRGIGRVQHHAAGAIAGDRARDARLV